MVLSCLIFELIKRLLKRDMKFEMRSKTKLEFLLIIRIFLGKIEGDFRTQ